jgi:hypothetical protein
MHFVCQQKQETKLKSVKPATARKLTLEMDVSFPPVIS